MKKLRRWLILPVALMTLAVALVPLFAQRARKPGENTTAHTLESGGRTRTYYLHVPPKLPAKPVPLVLVFHGGSGTPFFAERESKFSELADRDGFLVAYPEGVGKSWNDGRGDQVIAAQREGVDDVGFIAALLDDVAKRQTIDPKRIYATGISNGAIFSHHVASNLSSRIAAIAPVAGGLAAPSRDTFKPEHPVSVLILQGTRDPLVPYAGGDITVLGSKRAGILPTDETIEKWCAVDGCTKPPVVDELDDKDAQDGCRIQRSTWSGGKGGAEVVLYRIEGGGHTWPDGITPNSRSTSTSTLPAPRLQPSTRMSGS